MMTPTQTWGQAPSSQAYCAAFSPAAPAQAETWNAALVDTELAWAESLGASGVLVPLAKHGCRFGALLS